MSGPTSIEPGESSLDLSAEALLPEEVSPYHPSLENRPVLYVQVLDGGLTPRAGLPYELVGANLAEPRRGTTDENGELYVDDCDAGLYELVVDGKRQAVPTLSQVDLEEDGAAYRLVL
jgi:hypothetical protein